MESTQELNITATKKAGREKAILHWLSSTCQIQPVSLQPMPSDASSRRYFRLITKEKSLVVMDAPPPQENCHSYVAIAKALRQMGLSTPDIIEADLHSGFLLITDFGEATYLRTLTSANADPLYGEALNALANLQACRLVQDHTVSPFTANFMREEWALHKEWVCCKLLGLSLPLAEKELDACYELLVESAVTQMQCFMHRDYHSANLMVLPEGGCGILDFQDAFIGPVTYDLASLLRDCYIDWPKERVDHWAISYLQRLKNRGELKDVTDQTFLRWFDLMGMQRHLKCLMTFARKQVRDHQPRYLKHIPRALSYLIHTSHRYPELARLHDYYRITVQPAFLRYMK